MRLFIPILFLSCSCAARTLDQEDLVFDAPPDAFASSAGMKSIEEGSTTPPSSSSTTRTLNIVLARLRCRYETGEGHAPVPFAHLSDEIAIHAIITGASKKVTRVDLPRGRKEYPDVDAGEYVISLPRAEVLWSGNLEDGESVEALITAMERDRGPSKLDDPSFSDCVEDLERRVLGAGDHDFIGSIRVRVSNVHGEIHKSITPEKGARMLPDRFARPQPKPLKLDGSVYFDVSSTRKTARVLLTGKSHKDERDDYLLSIQVRDQEVKAPRGDKRPDLGGPLEWHRRANNLE